MKHVFWFILTILTFEVSAQVTNKSLTLKDLGDQYLNGQRKATDDSLTFLIFDSLSNPSLTTRQYSFKVANVIVKKSDGALSEAVGVYSLKYFSAHTKEFLSNVSTLSINERDSWAYYIGAELVIGAAPKNNQTELQFAEMTLDKIKASCKNCSQQQRTVLDQFMEKTLEVVKHNLE